MRAIATMASFFQLTGETYTYTIGEKMPIALPFNLFDQIIVLKILFRDRTTIIEIFAVQFDLKICK